MRALWKVLKILGWTLFSILGILLVAIAVIFAKPSIVLNDRLLTLGLNYAREHRIASIDARGAHLQVSSKSFFEKKFILSWDSLGYQSSDRSMTSKLGHSRLILEGGLIHFKPRITTLGPIEIASVDAVLDSRNSKPEAQKKETKPKKAQSDFQLPSFLQGARFEPISLTNLDARMISKTGETVLSGDFSIDPSQDQKSVSLKSVVRAEVKAHGKGQWLASAQLRGSGNAEGAKLVLDAKARQPRKDGKKFRSHVDAVIHDPLKLVPLEATIDVDALNAVSHLSRAEIHGCKIALKARESQVDCPLVAWLPLPPPEYRDLHLPTKTGARLRADFRHASFPPSPATDLHGKASLEADPVVSPFLEGQGGVKLAFDGVPSEFPRNFKADADLALKLSIPSFQRWVKRLRSTAWAVPAPFHALQGTIELSLSGRADLAEGKFPIGLKSRLASSHQKLDLDGNGQVQVTGLTDGKLSPRADFALTLSDVAIELPRMDLAMPPQFLPDQRIARMEEPAAAAVIRPGDDRKQSAGLAEKSKSAPKTKSDFTYAIKINTPPGHSLKILSNLAKAPIPIDLNLTSTEKSAISGSVHVGETPLEFFHRDASIDHFDLALATPTSDSPIDARIDVPYADYTVSVLLLSTMGDPRIKFTSDPPLPEDQVIATLLFGQPTEGLDPDQAQSVGNTQAALADRALGLASLYFLASTPVQSVGYDPGTQTFTAKVRLGAGTSLNVGTGVEGVQQVGLRKRLGPHWTVTTDVSTPLRDERTSVSTFLEWALRY